MSFLKRAALFLLAALTLATPPSASAHGYLLRSIPADGARLERAPVRVAYWFSEDLEPDFSSVTVYDSTGAVIATGGVDEGRESVLSARLPPSLGDGTYIAELRVAFASDGHVIVERRVFSVGAAAETAAGGTANPVVGLEVVWRAMLAAALVLLLGAFGAYALVLVPAWGNRAFRAGWLPPRVMTRLNAVVLVALLAALVASVLALIQQSMAFFDADAGQVLAQGLWSVVRTSTRFGDVWNWRMLLLALIGLLFGASLYWRESDPDAVRPFWIANGWLAGLLLGTLSLSAHASGSLLWPWVALAADWAHTAATGLWIGGLATLVVVLPVALAPYQGEARRGALLAALRRFSTLAGACAVVVVATGIYSASNWVRAPGELASPYGVTLVVKIGLVGLLLLVALAHHMALRPERYHRWSAALDRVKGFLPTLRLEAALAGLVLIGAAALTATPPPTPDFLGDTPPPPESTLTVDDVTATATVTPGGPGINSYEILLARDGEPVEGRTVMVQLADPARDRRGEWLVAEPAGDGLYVATGDEIDRAGTWWMLLMIDGERYGALDWSIRQEAALLTSVGPNGLNLVALAAIGVAVGYALYPLARRFYRHLDLRPATVTVALGGLAATIAIIVATYAGIQSSQAQLEARINPTPVVVNSVFPDARSVERGQRLVNERCAGWGDDAALIRRLGELRDEALYSLLETGWRDLAPCAGLTESERWDVVNYLRTLPVMTPGRP